VHLEHTIDIARAPEEVFAYLARHENHVQFIEENVSCEQLTPGPPRQGAQLKNVARVFGRDMVEHFEVIEFDPPRVLAKASRAGSSFETSDRFELRPEGEGTRLKMVVEASPRNLPERVIIALLQGTVRRSMHRTLPKLKSILEDARRAPDAEAHSQASPGA
jgi:hypothetical protein